MLNIPVRIEAALNDIQDLPLKMRWRPLGLGCLLSIAAVLVLSGCSKPEVTASEAPRPVRTVIAGSGPQSLTTTYSGEVRARYESKIGFRTSGKVVSRLVEVGSHVRSGQALMRMDVVQESLQVAASEADVEAAQSRVAKLRQDIERTEQLLSKKYASQAELDQLTHAMTEAQAGLKAAQAKRQLNVNQRGYSELTAERDGVVTALAAEVGQVVAAGQPVVTMAADGEREVLVSVPESRVSELQSTKEMKITAWAQPGKMWRGTLRELAPDADSVTRTYLARVSVRDAGPTLLLGMTASVQLAASEPTGSGIRLPLTAIYDKSGQTQVWLVDSKTETVIPRNVVLGSTQSDDVWITSGLSGGETVVTAGVHLLAKGQKVRLLDTTSEAASASGTTK